MNTWDQAAFTAEEINSNIENGSFVVPPYQRGYVWSDKQKEQFVDTLKRGLPFGTILLYYDHKNNQHQIIDGLQRCSTIFDFINHPARYFDEDDIAEDLPQKLAKITEVINSGSLTNGIKDHLIRWVKTSFQSMADVKDIQYIDYAYAFTAFYPTARGKEPIISKEVQPTLRKFKDLCESLCQVRIPAIVIKGDDDALPEIFERINSKGTQLSKYQIYAATWRKAYLIDSPKLQDLIRYNKERYECMAGDGTDIADFDAIAFAKNKKLNLFEIAYALGKRLGHDFPSLFETKDNPKDVDSLGFSLITACVGMRNAHSKNLHTRFEEIVGNNNVNLFLERILQCVETAYKLIGKFNNFKVNATSQVGPLHTEFQMVSLISNIFVARYTLFEKDDSDRIINFQLSLKLSNPSWENYEYGLKRNAWKRYCLDILNTRWKGTGDKKLDSIVFDADYYTQTISWHNFESSLYQWYNASKLDKREYKRIAPPKEPEKMFFALLYLPIFTAEDQADHSRYDVEHLATKNLMRKCLEQYEGQLRLPIGSIGNLCLLPQYENRSKRDRTIYDDTTFLQKSKYQLTDLEQKFTFTVRSDLAWLTESSYPKEVFETRYNQFIDSRFSRMVSMIKSKYDK